MGSMGSRVVTHLGRLVPASSYPIEGGEATQTRRDVTYY